jgi:hypothetical protein
MDYGPLTLVEGWFEVDLNRLEENILPLMERFKRISMLIDRLLAKRAR